MLLKMPIPALYTSPSAQCQDESPEFVAFELVVVVVGEQGVSRAFDANGVLTNAEQTRNKQDAATKAITDGELESRILPVQYHHDDPSPSTTGTPLQTQRKADMGCLCLGVRRPQSKG
jgi:hypothetical protein